MGNFEKIIKTSLALLLLICLFDMPYGYYQLVRFLAMLGFGYLAYQEKEKANQGLFFLWLGSAILINPILKISLGRGLWNIVDVIWAVILLATLSIKKMENK